MAYKSNPTSLQHEDLTDGQRLDIQRHLGKDDVQNVLAWQKDGQQVITPLASCIDWPLKGEEPLADRYVLFYKGGTAVAYVRDDADVA